MAKVVIRETPAPKTQDKESGGDTGRQKADHTEGENNDLRVRKTGFDRDPKGD